MDIPVDNQTFFDETDIEIAGWNERSIQWIYTRQLRETLERSNLIQMYGKFEVHPRKLILKPKKFVVCRCFSFSKQLFLGSSL